MHNGSVGNCTVIFTLQMSPAVCTPVCCNFARKFTSEAEKGTALIRKEMYAPFAELPSLSIFKNPILTCWTNFLQDFWDVCTSANSSSCLCTPCSGTRKECMRKPCHYSLISHAVIHSFTFMAAVQITRDWHSLWPSFEVGYDLLRWDDRWTVPLWVKP